jgi:hypothetical protein
VKLGELDCFIFFVPFVTLLALAADLESWRAGASGKRELRLKTISIHDPGVGSEAFRMLIPSCWKVEGGINWNHDLYNLASTAMRISSRTGPESLEIFPYLPLIWQQDGVAGVSPGGNYLGNIVLPLIDDPANYVQQMVLPHFRNRTNVHIVSRQELPEIAHVVAASSQGADISKNVKASKIRVEYQEAERWIEEDFFCVLMFAQSPRLPWTTFWGAERLYSFKAEKGKLEDLAGLFQTVMSSVEINPDWFNLYKQIFFTMWQDNVMAGIRSAGEISRGIACTSEEMSAVNRRACENQQTVYARVNAHLAKYLRGVEAYRSPFTRRKVELPSGYQEVWASAQGEYILSNNSLLDSNAGSAQTWQRMKREQ